jgi:hypothetical protein
LGESHTFCESKNINDVAYAGLTRKKGFINPTPSFTEVDNADFMIRRFGSICGTIDREVQHASLILYQISRERKVTSQSHSPNKL